jgi:hypothetical protein
MRRIAALMLVEAASLAVISPLHPSGVIGGRGDPIDVA